ncbi:MAG: hypothetical protein IPK12_00230 [Gemmatimonadetes bacterium]|nr:hypothetical protein [Gemmatimonadota bacterium]
MAVLAGLYGLTLALGQNPARTPNLDGFASPAVFGGQMPVSGAAAAVKTTASVSVAVAGTAQRAGLRTDPAAEWWFERIHVYPRGYDAGFVLSLQQVAVEVFNGFRLATQTLNAIAQTGPAGVTVADPYGTPVAFAPLRSRLYTVSVLPAGAAVVDNTIRWDFLGLAEPVFALTGSRLVPFTFTPDWSAPVEDAKAWLTDIIRASTDLEQRIALRAKPRRLLRYSVLCLDPREAAFLDQLVWGWNAYAFGVPLWPHATPVTAAVALGAVLVPCDTATREFAAGQQALLIRDPYTWEAFTIGSVAPLQLGVSGTIKAAWPAGLTLVVPLRLGRLDPVVRIDRPRPDAFRAALAFECDPA